MTGHEGSLTEAEFLARWEPRVMPTDKCRWCGDTGGVHQPATPVKGSGMRVGVCGVECVDRPACLRRLWDSVKDILNPDVPW